jgi:hypothetical protein
MDRHEAERERLVERICKLEPGHTSDELALLTTGELVALLKLAEAQQLKLQHRFAAGK